MLNTIILLGHNVLCQRKQNKRAANIGWHLNSHVMCNLTLHISYWKGSMSLHVRYQTSGIYPQQNACFSNFEHNFYGRGLLSALSKGCMERHEEVEVCDKERSLWGLRKTVCEEEVIKGVLVGIIKVPNFCNMHPSMVVA